MSSIHVVSKERHAGKRLQRYTSYAHTAGDAVAPLALDEIARACVAMPIAFMAAKGGGVPVGLLGLEPGRNLLVADDGHWLADYIPAAYRSHPFALGATKEGEPVLCVLEDSGLLSDSVGEPLFDESGERAPFLTDVLNFMIDVATRRQAAQRVCNVLQKHRLMQPWPIKRQTDAGEQVFEGLFRIDKTVLNQLSSDAFHELRVAGALPVVYCHLLSMQHLPKLAQLHQHAQKQQTDQAALSLAPGGELDLEFLNNGGTVAFGALDQSVMQVEVHS